MLAVENEHERIVRYLLNQGANPLLKNKNGEVASDLVATSSPIFKMLKGYELLEATFKNDLQKVRACLSAGVDINFQDLRGMTPLLIAVEQGFIQLTTFFLSKAADLTITSQEGKGVFELVTDEEISKLLQSAFCSSNQPGREPLLPPSSTFHPEKDAFKFFSASRATAPEPDHILNNLLLKSTSDRVAAFRLAEIYEQGKHGMSPSLAKAFEFYVQASCLGDPKASFYLGTIFESGRGEIVPDEKQAFSYYASAARQHHPDAEAHLEQLARSGNAQAQFALGYEYYRVIARTLAAVYWCTCAGIQEHRQALSYLSSASFDADVYFKIAHQYESAEMNPQQNLTRAIEFYMKALALNHKDAAMQLGSIYLLDHGKIKKDKEKAFSYYLKAAALGQRDALIPLERLGEEMGAQEQSALADFYRSILNYEKAAYWKTKADTEATPFEFNM